MKIEWTLMFLKCLSYVLTLSPAQMPCLFCFTIDAPHTYDLQLDEIEKKEHFSGCATCTCLVNFFFTCFAIYLILLLPMQACKTNVFHC